MLGRRQLVAQDLLLDPATVFHFFVFFLSHAQLAGCRLLLLLLMRDIDLGVQRLVVLALLAGWVLGLVVLMLHVVVDAVVVVTVVVFRLVVVML